MGIYNLNNPGRAGHHVQKFDGWNMVNIINYYVGDLPIDTKLEFRRALLVSHEARQLSIGGRINV